MQNNPLSVSNPLTRAMLDGSRDDAACTHWVLRNMASAAYAFQKNLKTVTDAGLAAAEQQRARHKAASDGAARRQQNDAADLQKKWESRIAAIQNQIRLCLDACASKKKGVEDILAGERRRAQEAVYAQQQSDAARKAANSVKLRRLLDTENDVRKIYEPYTQLGPADFQSQEASAYKTVAELPEEVFSELRGTIVKNRASLLRSLFLRGDSRDRACRLYSLCRYAERLAAAEGKAVDQASETFQRQQQSRTEEARRRASAELEALRTAWEADKKRLDGELAQTREAARSDMARLADRQRAESGELRRRQEAEDTELRERTEQARVACISRFRGDFCLIFPPRILYVYFRELTGRGPDIKNYACAESMPDGILMGRRTLDMTGALTGEAGGVIRELLEKEYSFLFRSNALEAPLVLPLDGCAGFYHTQNADYERAKAYMRTLCERALLSMPPATLHFRFCDLVNVRSFTELAAYEDSGDLDKRKGTLVTGGIQTDPKKIEESLSQVLEYITNLGSALVGYSGIREYNEANAMGKKACVILGIMDFPANLTDNSLVLLEKIVTSGGRCGVYPIIMAPREYLASASDTAKTVIANLRGKLRNYVIEAGGVREVLDGAVAPDERLLYYAPRSVGDIRTLCPVLQEGIDRAGKVHVDYRLVLPPREEWQTGKSTEGLSIPFAMYGASRVKNLVFDDGAVHALVVGNTGSGKSGMLHAVIVSALAKYPREELEIYLVDFKYGVGFKIYADYDLPNFRVITISNEPGFGLNVLAGICSVCEERAELMRGGTVADIKDYNSTVEPSRKLPRVLVILDEFHELFKSASSADNQRAVALLEKIVRLERSFGVHMLLATQSIEGIGGFDTTLSQIATRIAFKCSLEEARRVLGANAEKISLVEEKDAGSGVMGTSTSSGNDGVQIRTAWLPVEEIQALLAELDRMNRKAGRRFDARVLMTSVADSRNNIFRRFVDTGEILKREICIGEPMGIIDDRPVTRMSVAFPQAAGGNLLMVCRGGKKAQDLLFFLTASLLLCRLFESRQGREPDTIRVCNLCDGQGYPNPDRLRELCLSFPEHIGYSAGETASDALDEVYGELTRRTASGPGAPCWFIVSGLGLAAAYRGRKNADRLERILSEGPQLGIHTVLWADRLSCVTETFSLRLQVFGTRIAADMNDDDLRSFVGQPGDESLNGRNALLCESGRSAIKFRPYDTPETNWLDRLYRRIRLWDGSGT